MNITLKQVINILNLRNISYREKQKYFDLFISNRKISFEKNYFEHGGISNVGISRAYHKLLRNLARIINTNLSGDTFSSRSDYIYDHHLYCFYDDYDLNIYLDHNEPMQYDDNLYCSHENWHDQFMHCDNCSSITNRDDAHYVSDDMICDSCYNRIAHYCDGCDENVYNNNDCGCDNRGENNLDSDQFQIALSHLGVPENMPYEEKVDQETYGVESENEVRNGYDRYDVVDEIRDLFNKDKEIIACVRDGSLCEETGFEMVSTNATFDYHKNHFWNEFFKSDIPKYKLRAYKGSQTAIHIHFTRNAFTEHQLRHLNAFYHNPDNKSFLVDIAGRECEQYAKFVRGINYHDLIVDTDRKYRAINFNNSKTVEVRIFKSNMKQMSFFRCLELVHSINQFIKTVELDRTNSVSYTEYFDYLLNNPKKDYVNLLVWLDDNEYFSHLEHIEQFQTRYENFKDIVNDFRTNNPDVIEQERIEN